MATDIKVINQAPCCGVPDVHLHEDDGLDAAAATFKALADPTRLRILNVIARMGELCECNIVPAFGLSQPTISYHLKVLREAGLIRSERRGQWVYHRADQRAMLGTVKQLTEIGT
jgi:ArsR family transcriptional regulator